MNESVTYYPREAIQGAAKTYETPFFLYEEAKIRENCRNFRQAFEKYFPDFWPLYAVKANPNPQILKIIADEGFGTDCSSESEAWLSNELGLTGMFTGNYNPKSEFEFIKDKNLIFNLDDASMLETVSEVGMPETISFRINPGDGFNAKGTCIMSGAGAKYGVPIEKAADAYKMAHELGAKRFGIHMMTGSNVPMNESHYFADLARMMLEITRDVYEQTGIRIEMMNLGGGFGVPYRPEEESLDLDRVAKSVADVYKEFPEHQPRLLAEPGRYITANAGWLVGRVTALKESYKKYVGIDASSNDMPRPSIYDAYHHVTVINDATRNETVSVVGRICENSDQFAKDRDLPVCAIGDLVAIHNCGGHAFAMGHNYNGRPRHAEYLLSPDGVITQIRRAETIEDLFKTTNL